MNIFFKVDEKLKQIVNIAETESYEQFKQIEQVELYNKRVFKIIK